MLRGRCDFCVRIGVGQMVLLRMGALAVARDTGFLWSCLFCCLTGGHGIRFSILRVGLEAEIGLKSFKGINKILGFRSEARQQLFLERTCPWHDAGVHLPSKRREAEHFLPTVVLARLSL